MRRFQKLVFITVAISLSISAFADKEHRQATPKSVNTVKSTKAVIACEPSKTSTELYVNNVRTLIHTGGDMWWDLQSDPRYEVPAGSGRNALFAGSIWVGGKDANGQLKMAAQRFRQDGIDFWPGPLIISGAQQGTTSQEICRQYDKHFVITKNMVKEFREWFACSQDPECDVNEEFPLYVIPDIIMNWPAHGPAGGYDYYLAPFWDVDGDGTYNPLMGDFPYYEFYGEGITDDPDCLRPRNRMPKLFGDHTLWWVYNDRGNIHTETGGDPIGMEFRAQVFAFSTNDELNDMTFYNYNIINRSTYTLYETYFGVWTDADLGGAQDDYTGCDVERGLGYVYNGDDFDNDYSGNLGYGSQPPAIGIDFFEGPYQDPINQDKPTSYDTINGVKVLNCQKGDIMNGNINGLNFGDGVADNERWGMRRFLYFNNTGQGANPATTDPHSAIEHYNYLTGFWKDGQALCYGGTGHPSGGGDASTPTDFMFPGKPTTDKCGWGQKGAIMPDWSEETENNPPDDRRFVQSAGPFVLRPGAVNDITIGAVYARASSGGAWASVLAVRKADDKAQILFENCFRVLDGPDAPDLKIIEMDKKFIFHISNKPTSNNYLEQYAEKDPSIFCNPDLVPCDDHYRFQGYQVFQLKDQSASASDRYDPNLVRQVFQCDLKDNVIQLVNYEWSDDLGANTPIEEVYGINTGIVHTFVIDKDMFATSDSKLINHREYYYTAIAYSYNKTMPYNQQVQETFLGQKKPYLAGRNNIKKYKAIPHINDPEEGGTIIQGNYGYGPEITQIEGQGNAYNVLDLTQETIDEIMSGHPWKAKAATYQNGKGPLNVKIIDPLNVPEDSYTVKLYGAEFMSWGLIKPGAKWFICNSAGDTVRSDHSFNLVGNEQIFPEWGFSIDLRQSQYALDNNLADNNGFLEATMEFADESKPWLSFLPDSDGHDPFNWIRSGSYKNRAGEPYQDKNYDDYQKFGDPKEIYEKIIGGTWAPVQITSEFKYGTSYRTARSAQAIEKYEPLSSVDLYITSDKSKWSRSCVIEMCENEWKIDEYGREELVTPNVNYLSEGNALRFTLRRSPSVDKEGNSLNDSTYGLGWFPGYAIDVRTGERLNIMYGEDSWLIGDNGKDMMWNPTGTIYSSSGPIFGGKHYIWIMGHNQNTINPRFQTVPYDSCAFFHEKFMEYNETGSLNSMRTAWIGAMWTAIPLHNSSFDLLSTDVKIRLRVATPIHQSRGPHAVEDPINDNLPMYTFNTYDVKSIKNDHDKAVSALDLINVVPNPYYGHSWYEKNQLDNYVRITNLPRKCIISIYNVGGTLIRKFDKDSDLTYIDWDLKNSANISIASGVYIIHFNVPGVGERVIRWFGALRPIDLQNF